jgi:peptide/nickel transport system substrate-binding protein
MRNLSTCCCILLASIGVAAQPAMALEYSQSPTLDDEVAAGLLPPVEERLPKDPEVIVPYESIGTYGGMFRFGISGSSDPFSITYWTGDQGLVRYDASTDFATILPNVAASYEIDAEGKVFTFRLRDGVKWSDGTPLTADDVAFNMEDFVLNPEWAPTPAFYVAGGEPVKFSKLDDLTVTFTFNSPYGSFLHELAHPRSLTHLFYQKAYCSQFHPRYNTTDLGAKLQAAGTTDWRVLMVQKCGEPRGSTRFANPERPTLEAFVVKEGYTAGATQVVMERNPYFWAVDSEGNQLPYVDTVVGTIYSDPQALLLGAIGGNIDFQFRHLASSGNRPVLAANAEKGGYELFEVNPIGGTQGVIYLNLTHKDPEYRAIFGNKDFRIAMSIGTDRQEIIDTALLGEGEPWHRAPHRDSPMFHERYATQYLEYDPEEANRLLDSIGLDKRGADGFRLLPSGRPFVITNEAPAAPPELSDILEILSLQWARLGINLNVQVVERSLMFANVANNDHDMAIWEGVTSWLPGRNSSELAPLDVDARWGIAWVDWYTSGGTKGEEPPASVRKRLELFETAKAAVSFDERKAIVHEIADIAADEFEVIGVASAAPKYGIKKTKLVNVRPRHPDTSQYPPSLMLPWSWYWAE